jgi:hypothetical protein
MVEHDDFERLRKGQRVRKYYYDRNNRRVYMDGTVIKGAYATGLAYVKWDGTEIPDFNVNIYDVLLLKEK